MATADKNKSEQNLSVESRLKSLYELQTILSQIDRIKTVRGELPLEVRDLEDHIEGLRTRKANYAQEIEDLRKKSVAEKHKIEEAQALIAKYKEQLDNVRNNREFDLLSKEIEFQTLEIELCEKHINEYALEKHIIILGIDTAPPERSVICKFAVYIFKNALQALAHRAEPETHHQKQGDKIDGI